MSQGSPSSELLAVADAIDASIETHLRETQPPVQITQELNLAYFDPEREIAVSIGYVLDSSGRMRRSSRTLPKAALKLGIALREPDPELSGVMAVVGSYATSAPHKRGFPQSHRTRHELARAEKLTGEDTIGWPKRQAQLAQLAHPLGRIAERAFVNHEQLGSRPRDQYRGSVSIWQLGRDVRDLRAYFAECPPDMVGQTETREVRTDGLDRDESVGVTVSKVIRNRQEDHGRRTNEVEYGISVVYRKSHGIKTYHHVTGQAPEGSWAPTRNVSGTEINFDSLRQLAQLAGLSLTE